MTRLMDVVMGIFLGAGIATFCISWVVNLMLDNLDE